MKKKIKKFFKILFRTLSDMANGEVQYGIRKQKAEKDRYRRY
jgi:hypothetical protein